MPASAAPIRETGPDRPKRGWTRPARGAVARGRRGVTTSTTQGAGGRVDAHADYARSLPAVGSPVADPKGERAKGPKIGGAAPRGPDGTLPPLDMGAHGGGTRPGTPRSPGPTSGASSQGRAGSALSAQLQSLRADNTILARHAKEVLVKNMRLMGEYEEGKEAVILRKLRAAHSRVRHGRDARDQELRRLKEDLAELRRAEHEHELKCASDAGTLEMLREREAVARTECEEAQRATAVLDSMIKRLSREQNQARHKLKELRAEVAKVGKSSRSLDVRHGRVQHTLDAAEGERARFARQMSADRRMCERLLDERRAIVAGFHDGKNKAARDEDVRTHVRKERMRNLNSKAKEVRVAKGEGAAAQADAGMRASAFASVISAVDERPTSNKLVDRTQACTKTGADGTAEQLSSPKSPLALTTTAMPSMKGEAWLERTYTELARLAGGSDPEHIIARLRELQATGRAHETSHRESTARRKAREQELRAYEQELEDIELHGFSGGHSHREFDEKELAIERKEHELLRLQDSLQPVVRSLTGVHDGVIVLLRRLAAMTHTTAGGETAAELTVLLGGNGAGGGGGVRERRPSEDSLSGAGAVAGGGGGVYAGAGAGAGAHAAAGTGGGGVDGAGSGGEGDAARGEGVRPNAQTSPGGGSKAHTAGDDADTFVRGHDKLLALVALLENKISAVQLALSNPAGTAAEPSRAPLLAEGSAPRGLGITRVLARGSLATGSNTPPTACMSQATADASAALVDAAAAGAKPSGGGPLLPGAEPAVPAILDVRVPLDKESEMPSSDDDGVERSANLSSDLKAGDQQHQPRESTPELLTRAQIKRLAAGAIDREAKLEATER